MRHTVCAVAYVIWLWIFRSVVPFDVRPTVDASDLEVRERIVLGYILHRVETLNIQCPIDKTSVDCIFGSDVCLEEPWRKKVSSISGSLLKLKICENFVFNNGWRLWECQVVNVSSSRHTFFSNLKYRFQCSLSAPVQYKSLGMKMEGMMVARR